MGSLDWVILHRCRWLYGFLLFTLRSIPVGIAYAVWSGIGIVLISIAGWLIYGQRLDVSAMIGIGLIVSGAVVLNVFSKSAVH